jgi:hypothetical protein
MCDFGAASTSLFEALGKTPLEELPVLGRSDWTEPATLRCWGRAIPEPVVMLAFEGKSSGEDWSIAARLAVRDAERLAAILTAAARSVRALVPTLDKPDDEVGVLPYPGTTNPNGERP